MLCLECEQCFSKNGEQWIANACIQDNNVTFPLLQAFSDAGRARHDIIPGAGAFYAAGLAAISCDQLKYFASSMVWRWQYLEHDYDLGPYDEQFRRYLLGVGPFPPDASLHIHPHYRSSVTMTSHPVRRYRNEFSHVDDFCIPGLLFSLYLGKRDLSG